MASKPKKATEKKAVKAKASAKNDPLADLDLGPATSQKPTQQAAQPEPQQAQSLGAAATIEAASREEVEVGEVEVGFIDYIPTSKRSSGGSKYKFDSLVAPQTDAKTGKTKYSQFTVTVQEGVDPDKLRRSVQSATTQANRTGKAQGKYFVTRAVQNEGVFKGIMVIRTDDRPDGE